MSDQLLQFVPFVLMLGVMYLLVIRPQVQEKQTHDKMVAALVKDDRVVLQSGIHARIVRVDTDTLEVELTKGTQVKVDRSAVQRKLAADGAPAADKK